VPKLADWLDKCINPKRILINLCGIRNDPNIRPKLSNGYAYIETGKEDFHKFFGYVCSLPHVSTIH